MFKNLLITLGLSFTLLVFGLFVFMPKSVAQNNVLQQLLDVPAPPPPNPFIRNNYGERSPEFYSLKNPPADDAPIEDLLNYWKHQKGAEPLRYTVEPSPRVLQRLLAEMDAKPEIIGEYLSILSQQPEAVETVKRLYDSVLANSEGDGEQAPQLKEWLKYNSDYFSDELLQTSQTIRDTEEYVNNQEELLALARVNFDKARPLLDRMVNDSSQPISQTLANWAFYLHELGRGNSITASGYRDALMRTVEDKNAMPGNRDLALDALVYGGDFPGRDDWYFGLLEDETLHDLRVDGRSYTGLTTLILREAPDKYVDKMIELIKSSSLNVRTAAVRNLAAALRSGSREIVMALIPWLEDPNWAKETGDERRQIVVALAIYEIPESVPGLIAILNEKRQVEVEDEDYDYIGNSAANAARPMPTIPSPRSLRTQEVYPYRDAAINALIRQRSIQAAAALRDVLPEVEPWRRSQVVKAILLSGGFTVAEQVEGLEVVAKSTLEERKAISEYANTTNFAIDEDTEYARTEEIGIRLGSMTKIGNFVPSNSINRETFDPLLIKPMLGEQVKEIGEPSSELVSATSYRIKYLETNDPPIAEVLRGFMQDWRGDAVNAVLLDDLAAGKSTIDAIVRLLTVRREIRENQSNLVYDVRTKQNPIAYAVSACLLENEREYEGILGSASDDTKIALLGCARLIRGRISIRTVAYFLKSPNKTLATAAERYIESEDSPQARQIIYSLYPNDAKILGARFFFGDQRSIPVNPTYLLGLFFSVSSNLVSYPYFDFSALQSVEQTEKKLSKEIKDDEKLVGIYAYDKNYVRMYADRAVFSWDEDDARYYERKLSDYEFNYLKSYFASNDVGNLPPFLSYCGGCQSKELLMLGKQGGRRVMLHSNTKVPFFEGLEKIFEDMRRPEAKLRYWLEKDIAGLEILFADKILSAESVWKNGQDFRVLINDTQRERQIDDELQKLSEADYDNDDIRYSEASKLASNRRLKRAFESYSWHSFFDKKLGNLAGNPAGFNFISKREPGFSLEEDYDLGWSVKAGNTEVKLVEAELLKVVNGQTSKIKTGYFEDPVITDNGRWLVLTKFDEATESPVLTRINLQNNREYPIKFETKFKYVESVTFVSNVNKVLVMAGNKFDYSTYKMSQSTYYLVDAETGGSMAVKGDFRPILQKTYRDLQKASQPDEVWAAIPDEDRRMTEVGTYNIKTFVFSSVLKVNEIQFNSMDMWVDEPKNKVYVVYNGQLLSIPLKSEPPEVPSNQ